VVAALVVVCHKGLDLIFQIARQLVVLQQDAVFQRLVPAFAARRSINAGMKIEFSGKYRCSGVGNVLLLALLQIGFAWFCVYVAWRRYGGSWGDLEKIAIA
jgi:hypothetical protein